MNPREFKVMHWLDGEWRIVQPRARLFLWWKWTSWVLALEDGFELPSFGCRADANNYLGRMIGRWDYREFVNGRFSKSSRTAT